jgi:hypothetical protein
MKLKIFLMLIVLGVAILPSKANPTESKDTIIVYIFLHESCIISQYYTLPLKELHEEYANENIQFIGVFPNFSSKPDKIEELKKKYQIPFELKTDYYHTKKEKFGATVTPEVVVYNQSENKIIYKGRIDDAYARVGKRKRVTTTSELKNVLESIRNNQPIMVSNTQAVGCFIGKNKLK